METENLGNVILELYNNITSSKNATLEEIANNFSNTKIYEPLVHSSKLFGKVPTNRHILEEEIDEFPFQLI